MNFTIRSNSLLVRVYTYFLISYILPFSLLIIINIIGLILWVGCIIFAFKLLRISYTSRQLFKLGILLIFFQLCDFFLTYFLGDYVMSNEFVFWWIMLIVVCIQLYITYRLFRLLHIEISLGKYIKFMLLQFFFFWIIWLSFSASFSVYTNNGTSMMPTYAEGDVLIVDKLFYNIGSLKHWDVVVFRPGVDTNRKLSVKRVIALPGDTIDFQSGSVYIKTFHESGFRLISEPYLSESNQMSTYLPEYPEYKSSQFLIPPDQYWLMGDNRQNSSDSRTCFRYCTGEGIRHTIPKEDIIWRVIYKF